MAESPWTFPFRWSWAQVVTVEPGCGLWLAQRLERRPDLLREQSGLFPGGEVAAPGGLVEVDEVGIDLLRPAARGPEDFAGEDGEADRELYFGGLFPGRDEGSDTPAGLPVQPGRGGRGARQPVQGYVVEDVVPGQAA